MQCWLALVVLREAWCSRSAASIAVLGELAWIVAGTGWVIYGIWAESYIVAVSGAVGVLCCTVLCLLVRRDVVRGEWLRYAVITALFALSMAGSIVLGGVQGLSLFLAVFGFVQFIPQLRLSLTQLIRSDVVAGVPVYGAAFRAVYTGLWCIYAVTWGIWGAATIDWPLAVWGATGSVAFALQAAVGIRSRRALVAR